MLKIIVSYYDPNQNVMFHKDLFQIQQGIANRGGVKWELRKIDRALIRMWQQGGGINKTVAK